MKPFLRLLSLLLALSVMVAADTTPQQKYIDEWAATAVREMYRSGVPASITLAQGILESRSGLSALAAEGNNHFGIKCHSDWKGKTMKVDDDRKGECFRVYSSADESFRDHSDFLRYQNRYKFLFDYASTDYESWAYGLKQAGYATDPAYPSKLIKIIEDYGLAKYDKMTQAQAQAQAQTQTQPDADVKEERKPRKSSRKSESVPDVIPESPHSIEEARPVSRQAAEEFHFSLARQVYQTNGVPFVYAIEGETYESLARANNLFFKEILAFNDLSSNARLLPGTVVFLQKKKSQAPKGMDKYIVEADGEDLRDICQTYGVSLKAINKLNSFSAGHKLREGDTILLRK